jgi:hypothetical protein
MRKSFENMRKSFENQIAQAHRKGYEDGRRIGRLPASADTEWALLYSYRELLKELTQPPPAATPAAAYGEAGYLERIQTSLF